MNLAGDGCDQEERDHHAAGADCVPHDRAGHPGSRGVHVTTCTAELCHPSLRAGWVREGTVCGAPTSIAPNVHWPGVAAGRAAEEAETLLAHGRCLYQLGKFLGRLACSQ